MNNRILLILLYLLFVVPINSCQDKKIEPSSCYLTAIKNNKGEVLQSFEYNQNGQLIKHTLYNFEFNYEQKTSYAIEYNSNGKISRILESNNYNSADWEHIFEYTNNGSTVVQKKRFGPDGTFTTRRKTQFNSTQQIIEYDDVEAGVVKYIYNEAGNIIQIRRLPHSEGNEREYAWFDLRDYDDKISPFLNPISLRLYMQLMRPGFICNNNYQQSEYFHSDETSYGTNMFSYVYNQKNYPIEQSKNGYIEVKYEYNCP